MLIKDLAVYLCRLHIPQPAPDLKDFKVSLENGCITWDPLSCGNRRVDGDTATQEGGTEGTVSPGVLCCPQALRAVLSAECSPTYSCAVTHAFCAVPSA